jgi:hypothetical protein
MRNGRNGWLCAVLLALAPAAHAVDFSGVLPHFSWPAPSLPRIEAPFHPAPAPAPAGDESGGAPPVSGSEVEAASAVPPRPEELDPTLQTGAAADEAPAPRKNHRTRGWRGLLPGSLK